MAHTGTKSFKKFTIIAIAVLCLAVVGFGLLVFSSRDTISHIITTSVSSTDPSKTFAHYHYLSEPQFDKTIPLTEVATASAYSFKKTFPTASEVANRSKVSYLIQKAYAESGTTLAVYKAARHEVTEKDAVELAKKFDFLESPKKSGFPPPGYYEFLWKKDAEVLQVFGGSGSGGFEYYKTGTSSAGKAPADEEAITKAKEFLHDKGIDIDSSYIVSVLSNVSTKSSITGISEDQKQVYFRKKLNNFPVYEWEGADLAPQTDRLEVWVGVGGRILRAINNSYWTTIDLDEKTDYQLKEPAAVFEDIKKGRGKLAWMDEGSFRGNGITVGAPTSNFAAYGMLKNIEFDSVDLAYYHERKTVVEPEFYQPIYLFTGTAVLDWKESYTPQTESEDKLRGKKAKVVIVAPAVLSQYFFEVPITIGEGNQAAQPIYFVVPTPTLSATIGQSVQTQASSSAAQNMFYAKLGIITDVGSANRDVVISWAEQPEAEFKIYLKMSGDREYSQAAQMNNGESSTVLTLNKYIDYVIKVASCIEENCKDSNELFLPQEQKSAFLLKRGAVTAQENGNAKVYLSWEEVPHATRYSLFKRSVQTDAYTTPVQSTQEPRFEATVTTNVDNFFLVQACNEQVCFSSNEIVVEKQAEK